MDNKQFTELIKTAFEDKTKFNFVKKVNIVDSVVEELPVSTSQLVVADVLVDGVTDTVGDFEFVSRQYPNIKSGATLTSNKELRLTDVATNLAISCHIRLNALLSLYMFGQGSMGSMQLKTEAPTGLHTDGIRVKDGITSIKDKLKYMADTHEAKYDRITLNSTLLTLLTGELQIRSAKKKLKTDTGLKIDVDDSFYRERQGDGMVAYNFVPNDTVLFSNSKNDKSDTFYFANLPVIGDGEDSIDGEYGIVGYIKDDKAWAVLRGVPILKDKTAFATIRFQ